MTRSSGKSKLSWWSLTQKICRKLNASFTRGEEDYDFDGAWKARFLEDAALHTTEEEVEEEEESFQHLSSKTMLKEERSLK